MTRPDKELFKFGCFRLDPAEHLLLRDGEPVPLEPKVFETLLVLIRHAGRLVGKDELMQTVWPDSFVEESNLTRNISVLRKALNRNDRGPQYIETVPKLGYRFVGEVRALAGERTELIVQSSKVSVVVEEEESDGETRGQDDAGTGRASANSAEHLQSIETGRGYGLIETLERETDTVRSDGPKTEGLGGRRRVAVRWWLAFAAVCLTVGFVLAWKFYDSSARQPSWKLIRLTADAGISDNPALSPDGRLVAYSSDPSLVGDRSLWVGELDLYVKHVAGDKPIRLTFDGAGNSMPDFSPDGSRIVFRSNRDGGGIYEMPALGGDVRLIARHGFNPRFSPDGTQVAYWVGAQSVAATVPGNGAV